jgi:hypothetical protein
VDEVEGGVVEGGCRAPKADTAATVPRRAAHRLLLFSLASLFCETAEETSEEKVLCL